MRSRSRSETRSRESPCHIPCQFPKAHRDAGVQIVILSVCHFCAVGMWNALNALGNLGTGDRHLAHACNTMGYFCGLLSGFAGGGMVNILGMKAAAMTGLVGQAVTLFSYFAYYYLEWFTLSTAVMLTGISSFGLSCFTAALGSALIHYPTEAQRTKFIAINSVILNVGGLAGAALALSLNMGSNRYPSGGNLALSQSSYFTVVLVACSGVLFGLLLVDPKKVKRADQVQIEIPRRKVKEELRALVLGFGDRTLLLLTPLFLASVWHEVVWFNYFNSRLFNVRSRAYNSCVYYMARIFASFLFQYVLSLSNLTRGKIRNATVLSLALLCCGSGVALSHFLPGGFTHGNDVQNEGKPPPLLDFQSVRGVVLSLGFVAYGSLETFAASFSFWLLGVLPIGNSNQRNRSVGWYRMFINMGGLLSWAIDVNEVVPYPYQWMANTCLWLLALFCVRKAVFAATAQHQARESLAASLAHVSSTPSIFNSLEIEHVKSKSSSPTPMELEMPRYLQRSAEEIVADLEKLPLKSLGVIGDMQLNGPFDNATALTGRTHYTDKSSALQSSDVSARLGRSPSRVERESSNDDVALEAAASNETPVYPQETR